jgi:glyoxylase-like metal-dependent hydrolase (beta-lactamase superfamily II)
VIVLSDTGVSTEATDGTQYWTLWTFLESKINPGNQIPYLVILSHCHYDHILGLRHLTSSDAQDQKTAASHQRPHVTIAASSYDRSFVTPTEVLAEHSLCKDQNIDTPRYEIDMWCDDQQELVYSHSNGVRIPLDITVLHTPGHTPDSLSWYDKDTRVLYVGDSLYQQVSDETREAPWGPEQPMPIIFPKEGSLHDWWYSVKKLIAFVDSKDDPKTPEFHTELAAGHVTTHVDAFNCLTRATDFIARVLKDEVPSIPQGDRRGQPTRLWSEALSDKPDEDLLEFSLAAPEALVEEGRSRIPIAEWNL